MVPFYDFRTRTCIGDNGLRSLLHALYEHLLSDLNPAYFYNPENVTIREEIMELCEVGAQRGRNGDLETLKTQGGVAQSATCLKGENQRGTLEFFLPL